MSLIGKVESALYEVERASNRLADLQDHLARVRYMLEEALNEAATD